MNSFGQDSNELHTVDLCNLHSTLSPQQLFSPGLIRPCPEATQCSLLPKSQESPYRFLWLHLYTYPILWEAHTQLPEQLQALILVASTLFSLGSTSVNSFGKCLGNWMTQIMV